MMTDLLTEIAELKEKAAKYENRKEQDQKIIEQLEQLKQICENIIDILNPTFKEVKTRRKGVLKEALPELYEKLKAGVHVTSELIEKTYNIRCKSQSFTIMHRLMEMPDVKSTKDGRTLRLFI